MLLQLCYNPVTFLNFNYFLRNTSSGGGSSSILNSKNLEKNSICGLVRFFLKDVFECCVTHYFFVTKSKIKMQQVENQTARPVTTCNKPKTNPLFCYNLLQFVTTLQKYFVTNVTS